MDTPKPEGQSQAQPPRWPQAKPIALSVSVMLEGWTDDAAPGIGPMGNPLRAGVYDTQAKSWAEYGARTGVCRLLDVLADTGTRAVFYVSGIVAERHPDLMQLIVSQGHVIAAHAWSQHIIPACQTRDEEEADLKRCVAVIERTAGIRPAGWISPRATPSLNSPELLAREGLTWIADIFDRDLPYTLTTKNGDIVAMPFTMEVNDFPLWIRYGQDAAAFVRALEHMLDGWAEIGRPRACLDMTAHAHVFGRPAGAIAFKKAIKLAQANPLCWMTHHAEVAAAHLAQASQSRDAA